MGIKSIIGTCLALLLSIGDQASQRWIIPEELNRYTLAPTEGINVVDTSETMKHTDSLYRGIMVTTTVFRLILRVGLAPSMFSSGRILGTQHFTTNPRRAIGFSLNPGRMDDVVGDWFLHIVIEIDGKGLIDESNPSQDVLIGGRISAHRFKNVFLLNPSSRQFEPLKLNTSLTHEIGGN